MSVGSAPRPTTPPEGAPRPASVPWRGRRPSAVSTIRLAGAGLRRGWRLTLLSGVGMLAACAVVGTALLYASLLANVQLQATLRGLAPEGRDIEVVASVPGPSADKVRQEDAAVRRAAAANIARFTQPNVTGSLAMASLLVTQLGRRTVDVGAIGTPRVVFESYDYAAAGPHLQVLAGALPGPDAGGTPQAAITDQMAHNEGVGVGDVVAAQLGSQTGVFHATVPVRVVGIVKPVSDADPFWNGRSFYSYPQSDTDPYVYPVLLDRTALLRTFSPDSLPPGAFPFLVPTMTQYWIYYTEPARIDAAQAQAVGTHLATFRTHLAAAINPLGAAVSVLTHLDASIADVQRQLALLGLPLVIVASQTVGLALLFAAAMGALLVEGQAGEVAMLRSRGASGAQLVGAFALLGVALAALAAAAAALLASVAAVALIRRAIPAAALAAAGAGPAYLRGLADPRAALGPALATALLAVGAVLVAVARALGFDILAFRREQGRATRQPFWRRYYLDLGLAVVCALGYLELGQLGTVDARLALGQGASGPLLLAAPELLLLAGGLLLLRVFPVVAGFGMRLAVRARGATGLLALAEVERTATGALRLALRLALAVGLGLFGLAFDASLGRNAIDLANYQAGADLRLVEQEAVDSEQDAANRATLAGLAGVTAVSPAYRGQVQAGGTATADTDVLAIDPATWGRAAGAVSWRADYAGVPLATLLGGVAAHQWGPDAADAQGQTAAGDASHPVWALISQTFAAHQSLAVGSRFVLTLPNAVGGASHLTVGAIVRDFPTLYPDQAPEGFVVVDLSDYLGAIHVASQGQTSIQGPDEYWVATAPGPRVHDALVGRLGGLARGLSLDHVVDRAALLAASAGSPVQEGVRGLLRAVAVVAAALAALATLVQAAVAARRRAAQFAVLRALGMARRQLVGLLVNEQLVAYGFGVLGGTLLGALLAVATLPYLQFGGGTIDPATLGVPPYVVVVDPAAVAAVYGALVGTCVLALLVVAARAAAAAGVARALRVGED